MAMDSSAQFLAAAEHRLIPARARYGGNELRRTGYRSVWGPACQDQVAGGHALAVPTFATPGFKEFFQLGRALRVTLPTGMEGVVRLFVVYGYHGLRRTWKSL